MDKYSFAMADAAYDENKFSKAMKIYRQVSMYREPSRVHLEKLATSERYDRLDYLKRLRELYPKSTDIQLAEASYQARIGKYENAIRNYTDVIENSPREDKEKLHFWRFCINSEQITPDVDLLYADFQFLWKGREEVRNSLIVRILKKMWGIKTIEFIERIKRIINDKKTIDILKEKIEYMKKINIYL